MGRAGPLPARRCSPPCAPLRPGSLSASASPRTRRRRRRWSAQWPAASTTSSVALGDSSTYRGSTGIVPPPPVPENAIAALTAPFRSARRSSPPRESSIPSRRTGSSPDGRCDATGMTRALITDPDLPRKAREGRLDDVLRCIGCNACIAHYHAGTPIACAQNPRTGRERTLGAPARAAVRRRIVVVGGGPAGLAAAAEAGAAGHEVVLLERAAGSAARSRSPARRRCTRSSRARCARNYAASARRRERRGPARGRSRRRRARRSRPMRSSSPRARGRTSPACARGRRDRPGVGRPPRAAGRAAGASSSPTGAGTRRAWRAPTSSTRPATRSPWPSGRPRSGETLHQYQRNLYAARLYRAGVRVEHHLELIGAEQRPSALPQPLRARARDGASGRPLVLALGRVPERAPARRRWPRAASRSTRRGTAWARVGWRRRSSRERWPAQVAGARSPSR